MDIIGFLSVTGRNISCFGPLVVGVRVRGQGFFQDKFGVEAKSGVNVLRFSNLSKMIKVLAVEVLHLRTLPRSYWSHVKQFCDR